MQTITLAMSVDDIIGKVQDAVWGWPLIILILAAGVWLTVRTGFVQVRHLGKALKFMVKNEDNGEGEVTSFGALCTALSATIGTGNIVGVATAICLGGPGALLWMLLAAFFGMATKYSEGFLAIKYREKKDDSHYLGGPFYYIEKGMGSSGSGWPNCLPCLASASVSLVSAPLPRLTVLQRPCRISLIRSLPMWRLRCLAMITLGPP